MSQVPKGLPSSIRYAQLRRNNISELHSLAFVECPFASIVVLDDNRIDTVHPQAGLAQRFSLYCYLRAVGRQVLWSAACVCLCVCVCVCVCARTVFVRKISQERVHGSPPNLVGGSRG